jgi:hypothetical protein
MGTYKEIGGKNMMELLNGTIFSTPLEEDIRWHYKICRVWT